jgi:hypothetical protein
MAHSINGFIGLTVSDLNFLDTLGNEAVAALPVVFDCAVAQPADEIAPVVLWIGNARLEERCFKLGVPHAPLLRVRSGDADLDQHITHMACSASCDFFPNGCSPVSIIPPIAYLVLPAMSAKDHVIVYPAAALPL